MIGCEDRLQSDMDCVGWGDKLYSNSSLVAPANVDPVV